MDTNTTDSQSDTFTDQQKIRRLRRSNDDRMLAGVAGGIARYLNADATLVRVIIVALTLFSGTGALLYLAAWLLIPADDQDESIAVHWIDDHRQDGSR
jgi:phage shock protein PspC (stress-responsive transcriptional regulator)